MFFKRTGILGINARNLLYLDPFNPEKAVKLADNKLKTKAFLSTRNINAPKLINTIKNLEDLKRFNFSKLPQSFVLKPNQGYGGEGIIPIKSHRENTFITVDNKSIELEDLKEHINQILKGYFSIKNGKDIAFFEQLIISHPTIGDISYKGLPDVRVIVHNLVPVMAMLRIPTKESNGKANLHQGAIGAGIDIAKGEITYLTYKNQLIKEIPDIGNVKGLKIPFWDEVLEIACKSQLATNLGYLAADIAIDKHHGPILLEINARPGLGIQTANQAKLRARLEKVADLEIKSIQKGIRVAKDMFGYTFEKNVKSITGKKVISNLEKVDIIHDYGTIPVQALISTTKKNSVIDIDLAKQISTLQIKKIVNENSESKITIKLKLKNEKIISSCKTERLKKKKYNLIIGTKDLANRFLIDPSLNYGEQNTEKNLSKNHNFFRKKFDSQETDQKICKIIGSISVLSILTPNNLDSEIQKFKQNKTYNPQFTYNPITIDTIELRHNLSQIYTDESPFGTLASNKIKELNLLLDLIENRGSAKTITEISSLIYGSPNKNDLNYFNKIKLKRQKEEKLSAKELKIAFEETLNNYGINNWKIIIKKNIISNCVVNKNRKIFIKEDGKFTKSRIDNLIIHEIETHLLTAENGLKQNLKLFNKGFAGYLKTQEGLALYNLEQNQAIPYEIGNKTGQLESILLSLENSFVDTFNELKQKGLTTDSALRLVLRAKRGLSDTSKPGAFTKDYVYYSGKKEIDEFIENGGNIKDLYLGKFNVKDLDLIKQIANPEHPRYVPKWIT